MTPEAATPTDDLQAIAGRLLNQDILAAQPAAGGGNNRVYRVTAEGGPYALKFYPPQDEDRRDRLGQLVQEASVRLVQGSQLGQAELEEGRGPILSTVARPIDLRATGDGVAGSMGPPSPSHAVRPAPRMVGPTAGVGASSAGPGSPNAAATTGAASSDSHTAPGTDNATTIA